MRKLKFLFNAFSMLLLLGVLPQKTLAQFLYIYADYDNYICSNTSVTFFAFRLDTATLQWKKNGVAIAGATTNTYVTNTLVHNDMITCEIVTGGTNIISNTIKMNVAGTYYLAVPTVTINNGINDLYLCSNGLGYNDIGATSTFAGSNPVYQWKKNGINIGTNNSTISISPPYSVRDTITCEVSSSLSCAVSTPSVSNHVAIHSSNSPALYITSSDTEACIGDTLTYHPHLLNDCSCFDAFLDIDWNWAYMSPNGWVIIQNGIFVVDSGAISMYPYVDCNVDIIWEGGSGCEPNTGSVYGEFKGTFPTIHTSPITPSVNITSTEIVNLTDTTHIFTAHSMGGGRYPTYQWKKNGIIVPDATFKQVAFNNLQSGDIITCNMTSSLSCAAPAVVTSNAISLGTNSLNIYSILYPNPAISKLNIFISPVTEKEIQLSITDMLGKSLSKWEVIVGNNVYEHEISIENLSQGVYFLSVKIGEKIITQKFIKE